MLRLEQVSVAYGARQALAAIDLEIRAGEFVGVCGVSGSGKSTLASILTLHQKPSSGRRLLHGEDCTQRCRREDRSRLQLVFQDPGPSFPHLWTLKEILEEARRGGVPSARREAEALLSLVQLPAQWSTRQARELSGGERRRLAIARALSVEPELLVLDESLSGLEEPLQEELLLLLEHLRQSMGLSVVLVSHEIALLRKAAERLVVLDGGRLVEDGPAEAIWKAPQAVTRRLMEASTWA